MSSPTKPGYYWAKIKNGDSWEIVEVRKDYHLKLMVDTMGTDDIFIISDFTFGPEVPKPKDLE